MIVEVLFVINSQKLLALTAILRVFCIISKKKIHHLHYHAGSKPSRNKHTEKMES